MNSDPLDRRLQVYARQPLPAAPADLVAGVWHEIERRRRSGRATPIGWHEILSRPLWAIAGLAFAIIVGAAPAWVFTKSQQARQLARQSLHFEVFSTEAPGPVVSVLAAPDRGEAQPDSP